jgi:hypothetical protein
VALPCEGRCEHPGSTMPRANYSITVCLIFLGLAVLVRTVAIAQRACDVLLPPTSCDYWGHAIAPIAIGYTGVEPTAAIYARPVVNIPVTNPPSVEGPPPVAAPENPPEGVASRAGHQSVSEVASEKQPKRIAPTNASHRRHHEASSSLNKKYNYRPSQSGLAFQNPWGTAGW